MTDRIEAERALLRSAYPHVEFLESDPWARIPVYSVPGDIWTVTTCEVAFQMVIAGQQPYGFWVRPGLVLKTGGTIQNYSFPVSTPFGEGWGQFSWSPETWVPLADVRRGANMLAWVQSFADRLRQGA
jgi:hypothetical protein